MSFLRPLRALAGTVLILFAVSCATVPPVQHAVAIAPDGHIASLPAPCPGVVADADRGALAAGTTLRVASWNIHKNGDPGWSQDLARLAAKSDLLLIQEASLTPALRGVLSGAGFDGVLAAAFAWLGHDHGVLTAARVPPAGACVQRTFEPLLQLPKSAVITRYAIAGMPAVLAVANVHSINFTLALDAYRSQLEAVARELETHSGPVIVAGDFNTWSPARSRVVEAMTERLGLVPVVLAHDSRSRFFDRQVDYVFVRGLEVLHAEAPVVASSDHNPVLATLRLPAAKPGS